jgi:hypothetical protein
MRFLFFGTFADICLTVRTLRSDVQLYVVTIYKSLFAIKFKKQLQIIALQLIINLCINDSHILVLFIGNNFLLYIIQPIN